MAQIGPIALSSMQPSGASVLRLTAGDGPWMWARTRYDLLEGAIEHRLKVGPRGSSLSTTAQGSAHRERTTLVGHASRAHVECRRALDTKSRRLDRCEVMILSWEMR